MRKEILLNKHPLWSATYPQMARLQLAYLNGIQYKLATRPKRPSEDANIHKDLVNHTAAQPLARYVVDTINDVVFEPGIKRRLDFTTPDGSPIAAGSTLENWWDLFLLDSDLRNTHLDGVMEQIGDLTSIFGHCWVAVDRPPGDPRWTRPVVIPLSPLNVWDWDYCEYNGVRIPERITICEWEDEEYYSIKVYFLGDTATPTRWVSYKVEKEDPPSAEVEPEGEGFLPLGMGIPVFRAYTRRDPRSEEFGISDIDIACDVQAEHYKLECEAYQSLQFARTIIRAETGIKVPAHSGAIVRATEGQIETLSVDTGDVGAIISKQGDLLQRYLELGGLGGLSKTSQQVASGVSIIEERRQLHRVAKAKARQLEICEEQIWTYAARWMDCRWAGEIIYVKDYEAHDTAYRIAIMERAKQLVPDDPTINQLILQEVIGLLAPADRQDELLSSVGLQVEEVTPVTRDMESQTPPPEESDDDEPPETPEEDMIEDYEESGLGGADTPVTYTGQSYTTENAVAVQLGFAMGGGR